MLTGILGAAMTESQWNQATLAIRHGGLGVSDAKRSHVPARVVSTADFRCRGREVLGLADDVLMHPADLGDTKSAARRVYGDMTPLPGWCADPTGISAGEDNSWSARNWWTAKAMKVWAADQAVMGPSRDRVRFASVSSPHSGAWLAATPSAARCTLPESHEFRPGKGRHAVPAVQRPHGHHGGPCFMLPEKQHHRTTHSLPRLPDGARTGRGHDGTAGGGTWGRVAPR